LLIIALIIQTILKLKTFNLEVYFDLCPISGGFIDAQSFSNSFEGVHGVVKKFWRGSSIFVFIAFLCNNFSKFFEGVNEVPPSSPLSPPAGPK
jgi:hypothetical protein